MASKLFHTVVGFGIALGAASLGCSAEATSTDSTDESALTEPASKPAETTPPCHADAGDAGPDWSAFCDATWPTTKGGVQPFPACVDPNNECNRSEVFDCAIALADGACKADGRATLAVCAEAKWQCKPGRVRTEDCKCWVWGDGEGESDCPAQDAGADSGR